MDARTRMEIEDLKNLVVELRDTVKRLEGRPGSIGRREAPMDGIWFKDQNLTERRYFVQISNGALAYSKLDETPTTVGAGDSYLKSEHINAYTGLAAEPIVTGPGGLIARSLTEPPESLFGTHFMQVT